LKYALGPRARRDFKGLAPEHQKLLVNKMVDFSRGCDIFVATGKHEWPAAMKVRQMSGHDAIWEMRWNRSRPDGRATFSFVMHRNQIHVQWRRFGDHGIYDDP